MLQTNKQAKYYLDPSSFSEHGANFSFARSWSTIQRQWRLIATIMCTLIIFSTLYIIIAPAKYTASTTVLIGGSKNQVFEKTQIIADAPPDTSTIDSQVEVIKSESVILPVVRKLKLINDSEFSGSERGILQNCIAYITSFFSKPRLTSETKIDYKITQALLRNLIVKRVGLTDVIEITYTSLDPDKSAQIANAIADSYIISDLDAKFEATRRTGEWLQDRIKELRMQSAAADEAVRKFKEENNLVDTSRGLISQQQLTDLNTQLIAARTLTAEAKAKLDALQDWNGNVTNSKISDALKSDVISRLRAQYLDFSAKESEWANRYGADHLAAVRLRDQMHEISKSISLELNRITETYKSDYKIASAREGAIEKSLNQLALEAAGTTSKAQLQLRVLESTAQTYRTLHDNFLQRSMEATQQQTFPVSEARIITKADTPERKSSPKTLLILSGATFIGCFLGVFAVFVRERLDNVFRTEAQIEEFTGLKCFGILPKISFLEQQNENVISKLERMLPTNLGIYRYVIDAPFSRFAETLQNVKLSIQISGRVSKVRTFGIVSALPGEGKTTIAANFAAILAQGGKKILLIDSDLRHNSMTKGFIGNTDNGLLATIENLSTVNQVIWHDPISGIDFLPAEPRIHIAHTAEILSSKYMEQLINWAEENYDYVVLDLPPIMPVVDVNSISHLIDRFIMVVELGKTKKEIVLKSLSKLECPIERILGVILNKADVQSLKHLESYHYHDI
ncbi:polysaccharide biosynthesis tyrosine autokinase [Beijerinckia indica]|uniref:non-specific protein-tyrosine kinase n=1 Tax=Beijerinckia indica subsp. indica (strain ATCC 9039 / DSM 1715 / NCIMB 8712) TaxID=395963 RepID=B2IJA7_BEII9|nr:polysaccharide biosynthesis tyrosine autokinase [Beijerinckia indica]ACB96225.1 capsular exopolysaccharide family [Beijerinckia indica subsp. indica ATCC 9039]